MLLSLENNAKMNTFNLKPLKLIEFGSCVESKTFKFTMSNNANNKFEARV